jgi:carbon storage regulator CsrA
MLVVTRRPGEAIVIELPTGELIEAVVPGIKGNQVRLGTDAPHYLEPAQKA